MRVSTRLFTRAHETRDETTSAVKLDGICRRSQQVADCENKSRCTILAFYTFHPNTPA